MQLIIKSFSTAGAATWARAARDKFQGRGVHFVDSPVSGGPARAKLGDLTIMASGDDASLEKAKPLLDVMGRDVYIIQGGAGMGSTVKVQWCAPFFPYRAISQLKHSIDGPPTLGRRTHCLRG